MSNIYTIKFDGKKYWDDYIYPTDDWWEKEDDDFEVFKTYGITPTDLQLMDDLYAPTTVDNMNALLRMYEDGYAQDCWVEELVREFAPADENKTYRTEQGNVPGGEADMFSRLSYFIEDACRCCRSNEYSDGPSYHLIRIVDDQFGRNDVFIAWYTSCWKVIPDDFGSKTATGWCSGCPEFEWS